MREYLETYYWLVTKLITGGIFLYFILFPKKNKYVLSKLRKRIDVQFHISGLLALELLIIAVISFKLDKDTGIKFIYSGLFFFWLYTSFKDYSLLCFLKQAEESFDQQLNSQTDNSM